MYSKITHGYVMQLFDQNGQCTCQIFIPGDTVEWEYSANGQPLNTDTPPDFYYPFVMEQPCDS